MNPAAFLPVLSVSDVQQAAQLIHQAYAPGAHISPDDQRRIQQELLSIQKRPEAWGLVVPFLENQDPNVQFFGAHTAQVKIARDWDSFPQDNALQLRDLLLELTVHAVLAGRTKVILRKLFIALTSLALKIATGGSSDWPDWIISSVNFLSGRGVFTEYMLDFLSIVAEEIDTAALIGPSKMQMHQSLLDAAPMVVQAIISSITQPKEQFRIQEFNSALKCLQAWIPILRGNELTPLIPLLINLLSPSVTPLHPEGEFDESIFVPASDALQEITSKSSLSGGAGSRTLTDPLLTWLDLYGAGFADALSHSFCKLLVALGDHSNSYLASNIVSSVYVPRTRAHLVQNFLRLILGYTALPGYYGVDEEESEMTLGFWYLFQESLWSVEYDLEEDEEGNRQPPQETDKEKEQWAVVKAVYSELVQVLKRKVIWPDRTVLSGWGKDQRDKYQVYRRDVGDTLINAYYILRNDMLAYYLNDLIEHVSARNDSDGWEDIEATLHCIMSIQEAIPLEDNPFLARLFGHEVLGRLPRTGQDRIRRTTLGLIGTYASWFTTQSLTSTPTSSPTLLMNTVSYVVAALPEQMLCLSAANSLRDLCDANRTALAPHIGAFAELHAGLTGIPDTEKCKVLQSIASVIQALPPEEEIPPVQAIVSPVVEKLVQALQSSTQLPEEARTMIVVQLQTLTGVAKGLTRTTDSLLILEESPEEQVEVERVRQARKDYRMIKLREDLFTAIRNTVDMWSTDAGVSDALSELFRSITALPSDMTLLSLPAGPLLELVCFASQRQLTAIWLTLANMLIIQVDPPTLIPSTLKSGPNVEAQTVLSNVLPALLQTSLTALGHPGAMESNPDIVQAFFSCMDTVAKNFVAAFYRLQPGALDTLMRCAIGSLSLQERYSLVSACTFLAALISKTANSDELGDASAMLIQAHGRPIMRAILCGFASVAPRSATVNLIELLMTLNSRHPAETRAWMNEILFADDFVQSKAGPDAKKAFIKAVVSSRSPKKTRDSAQQFILVARGLEGSSFGYASGSM
ncbi:hypothetical protein SERLA73DRAFT_171188 [Serpula lacrymans var. lacrymans S7.3]|uniref:Importin-13 n=2 Tax=Serpula lacrymans var. lacrymans TaxID=341189 RepID=F8QAI8_SERL3|nr:uncharacterized protein SERLADRAFT_452971 [Serpula lacrymans var. lacrymans S7.9]EGN94778.1 hypothetical protein SERLA73DRAFT_171188 [Serpula lacrymans var. lacrymans S7.3]EGO20279.1 hypothetical protein SERLADRAFT_452971 [Serpula lacrymans var. lacrymans S7.9]